jgi:hypothetical protein
MLILIDENTRESLAIRVDRRLRSRDVIETLAAVRLCGGYRSTYVRTMGRSSSPVWAYPGESTA